MPKYWGKQIFTNNGQLRLVRHHGWRTQATWTKINEYIKVYKAKCFCPLWVSANWSLLNFYWMCQHFYIYFVKAVIAILFELRRSMVLNKIYFSSRLCVDSTCIIYCKNWKTDKTKCIMNSRLSFSPRICGFNPQEILGPSQEIWTENPAFLSRFKVIHRAHFLWLIMVKWTQWHGQISCDTTSYC